MNESDPRSGAMRTGKARIVILFGAVLACASSCKGVGRFDTGPGGAYCGDLTNGSTTEALTPDGNGEQRRLQLSLTLDTRQLAYEAGILGTLTSSDDVDGLCDGGRLFDKARLRIIQPVMHDVISGIQLTQDHEQDIFTWVDSSCQGTFVAIISLMVDAKVEVRLFKPMKESDAGAPPTQRSGYGVFSLSRNDGGCGF
jgi:hypothetical protein